MTENEKQEAFDRWYAENYDEWAEGEEGIALREELEQAFKSGIAELEKENAELRNNGFTVSAMTEQQLKVALEKGEQLEKENAELKVENAFCEKACEGATMMYKDLCKAKELIENIIRVTWGEGWNYSLDWKVKAEQFLSEVEK